MDPVREWMAEPPPTLPKGDEESLFDLIELFFFAYRDFVGGPDRLLEKYRFGRAHHRVMHFVNRYPGLTIAELLEILKITKQSLNRVLKELLTAGFVEARPGVTDRRQRLLFLTQQGRTLATEMLGVQARQFAGALSALAPDMQQPLRAFLLQMVEPGERGRVARLVGGRRKDNGHE